ncbi:nuclear transport factor 2 family protein [uncultured Paludibaculum sp.]|uniref:nuclear transport factor 2 family protein n=1 Tax=uncultured Paludibaculum sp. TaxID=1765020 RepID=UPI002AAB2F47|nr:nuclear transport factor 2 family protein [uncultured Paludibaculum sp.]
MRTRRNIWITAGLLTMTLLTAAGQTGDDELLAVRESVWRAWLVNDTKALARLVPAETVVLSTGEEQWKHQAEVFRESADFRASGGKLIRLEFPRTEVQHFGDVAIVWSKYILETETKGKRSLSSGRVTEIFVKRNGQWTNPGWHTDSEK